MYNANHNNPQTFFGDDESEFVYMSDASINSSLATSAKILKDKTVSVNVPALDESSIKNDYPTFAASFFNLLQNVENKIGARKK